MESLEGRLLIATGDLQDPNFFHTVVLLVRHSEEGALGLVLNRRSNTTIREAWQQVREARCRREDRLDIGGPCQGPLTALHSHPVLGGQAVLDGLYFTGDPEVLERLVDEDNVEVRFFVGYSGWGAGQLEGELKQGAWRSVAGDAGLVLPYQSDLWEKASRLATGQWLQDTLKIKHLPRDTSHN